MAERTSRIISSLFYKKRSAAGADQIPPTRFAFVLLCMCLCFCFSSADCRGQASSLASGGKTGSHPTSAIINRCPGGVAQLRDEEFYSKVFGGERMYRIFLPNNYDTSKGRYPVIYYFHGHSDRYTLEDYDHGEDTVPKICRFVGSHPVIVVAPDGYVADQYEGFYGGDPYDVRRTGGRYDFGVYFLEQVHAIDTKFRTLTSRRYRAVSGLSMGAFMSLYLSARYPDIIGSCSAFNPGPEFYVGEPGRRSLWRPKDYVLSFQHTPIRLVLASGDFIRQYTEETRSAFAAAPSVPFVFRQDEYPRHWATSIGETFEFHMHAFADAALDRYPKEWNYASAYDNFKVWGYQVHADILGPALIYLQHVTRNRLRVETRRWAPGGPPATCTSLDLTTAPLYRPRAEYSISDFNLMDNSTHIRTLTADAAGRLHLKTDCRGHEMGISGPRTGDPPLALLPVTRADKMRVLPGKPVSIPIRLWNPGAQTRSGIRVELTSEYPTVKILKGSATVPHLGPHRMVDLTSLFQAQFTAGDGDFARVRLLLKIATRNGGKQSAEDSATSNIDVLVAPADLRAPEAMEILDGRTKIFPIFWQGKDGGGKRVTRTVTEGKGNGNGILEPGEHATVWIRVHQGLDPFDKENWCRTRVYSFSPYLTESRRIEEDKRAEFTAAQNLTSVVALNPATPPGTKIKAILDCETYSFYFTPDVRYGTKPLYEPFQFHRHYLYLWEWTVKR